MAVTYERKSIQVPEGLWKMLKLVSEFYGKPIHEVIFEMLKKCVADDIEKISNMKAKELKELIKAGSK